MELPILYVCCKEFYNSCVDIHYFMEKHLMNCIAMCKTFVKRKNNDVSLYR